MERYKTFKTYKNSNRKRTISTGLTLQEAQKEVEEDLKINPKAFSYMLCFTEQ